MVNGLPLGWETHDFPKTILKAKAGRANQINTSDIKPSGLHPVIDQGKLFIAGYSDDSEKLYRPESPVIVFGDHTRILKYVDFPFIIGADGTKIIRPNPSLFNPKFFYFYLTSLKIPSRGYNRHFTLLKEAKVIRPPKPEQDAIAHAFTVIERFCDVHNAMAQTGEHLQTSLLQQVMSGMIKVSELTIPKELASKSK